MLLHNLLCIQSYTNIGSNDIERNIYFLFVILSGLWSAISFQPHWFRIHSVLVNIHWPSVSTVPVQESPQIFVPKTGPNICWMGQISELNALVYSWSRGIPVFLWLSHEKHKVVCDIFLLLTFSKETFVC